MKTGFDSAIERAENTCQRDLAQRLKAERIMAEVLIDAILKRDASVSVYDGEEFVLRRSKNKAEILLAMSSTDEDKLIIRDAATNRNGWFKLVYGNSGYDVVSDHSDNAFCNEIWEQVLKPLSDHLEEEARQ